ncbi:MAG: sodium:glutamate symporter, partial [Lachnospiraceae bacterium]|nr:sodium:glutamate symporter [Lachnospiraceae bacterium]
MTFSNVNGVFTIASDATMTLAFAGVLLLIGFAIKNAVKVLQKYCIPAPVIGGFLFMFITFIGHQTGAFAFTFTNNFQDTFMLCFFTTVGLGASLELLKKGGIALVVYWLIAGIVSIFQNFIGIGVGKLIGLDSAYALLASAISMIGGHGAAASYGKTFAEAGHTVAEVSGAASATFGLISAVLIGGPVGRFLVEKNHLKPNAANDFKGDASDVNKAGG